MSSDILPLLIKANLLADAAILVVLVLRAPVLHLFGARTRYLLWAIVPAAVLAGFLPAARMATVAAAPALRALSPSPSLVLTLETGAQALERPAAAPAADWSGALIATWAAGLVASLVLLALRQHAFVRKARAGQAGPAVVGLLRPRLCLPTGFANQFTHAEQQMILAHERTHLAHQDPRVNGLIALTQCLFWPNLLIHLAAHLTRIDQESACDEAVVAAHPGARRTYAEALLKTQLAVLTVPIGCQWPARRAGALEARIVQIRRRSPGRAKRRAGALMVALIALFAGYAAWAVQPPRDVVGAVQRQDQPADFADPLPAPASGKGAGQPSTVQAQDLPRPSVVSAGPETKAAGLKCDLSPAGALINCIADPTGEAAGLSPPIVLPPGVRILQVTPGIYQAITGVPQTIAPGNTGSAIEPADHDRTLRFTDGTRLFECFLPAGETLKGCIFDSSSDAPKAQIDYDLPYANQDRVAVCGSASANGTRRCVFGPPDAAIHALEPAIQTDIPNGGATVRSPGFNQKVRDYILSNFDELTAKGLTLDRATIVAMFKSD